MPLLRRRTEPIPFPSGILPGRKQADRALVRMLSRARRKELPLVMLRLDVQPAPSLAPDRFASFLEELSASLRISDLGWWDPELGSILLLLEDVDTVDGFLARLEKRADAHGVHLRVKRAHFPRQGVTLPALLEAVA
jgi:hypothetical protein